MQRILLVEDNEMNRDLISRRLKRRGFELILAVDGAEGIEKATSEKPDLIVMDMGLPVLDGYEATRVLKDSAETQHIPIIGLSAHAMSGDAQRALAAGCDDYDTKPVDWKRLIGKIDTLLAAAREGTASPGSAPAGPEGTDPGAAAAHVLVVDDNAVHREMICGRLAALGYTFDLATDAVGALLKLYNKSFDVVLLDVTLPAIEPPLLEQIRSNPAHRDLPVLMLSTIDAVGDAIACLSRGAEDFVPQPFHQEVLEVRLRSCLERRRLRRRESRVGEGLDEAARRADHLLGCLLPAAVVKELTQSRRFPPRRCPEVAVLCCAVEGFSSASDAQDPLEAVQQLQRLILAFEEVAQRHRLENIRTAGESFMAAAGLFTTAADPALDGVRCALAMKEAAATLAVGWPLRIGVHLGPVVAGIVGHRRVQFDLWGSTVQIATRVKDAGAANTVTVSEAVWQRVADHSTGKPLGKADLEAGGTVNVYRVDHVAD